MANNCLVTKLKAVVDNNNLVHLGHVQFELAKSSIVPITNIASSEKVSFEIKSNHVFTDSTKAQDYGKKIEVTTPSTRTVLYFKGSEDPVVLEVGPIDLFFQLEGDYPINEGDLGYTALSNANCVINIEPNRVAAHMPMVRAITPKYWLGGDIEELIDCDSLRAVNCNTITGTLENLLVGKYNRPTSVQRVENAVFYINGAETFNGVQHLNTEVWAIYASQSPYITVRLGGASGTVLGTWDGTSWTYA